MDYSKVAEAVLKEIGGKGNVDKVVHCATRLRFNLNDMDLPDKNEIEKISGVKGCLVQGGQFQIIIGNEVPNVYAELQKLIGTDHESTTMKTKEQSGKKKANWGSSLISTLTEIFAPALPAITGAGMFKALLAAVVAFKLMDTEGQTYQILYAMSDAVFYFLPMIIGYTAAKKFGAPVRYGR